MQYKLTVNIALSNGIINYCKSKQLKRLNSVMWFQIDTRHACPITTHLDITLLRVDLHYAQQMFESPYSYSIHLSSPTRASIYPCPYLFMSLYFKHVSSLEYCNKHTNLTRYGTLSWWTELRLGTYSPYCVVDVWKENLPSSHKQLTMSRINIESYRSSIISHEYGEIMIS